MKKILDRKTNPAAEDSMRSEYRFDYSKSTPNRFVAKMSEGALVVADQDRMKAGDQVAVNTTSEVSETKIYEENAKVTAIFWEWRHKTMTHFFGAFGAMLVVASWVFVQAKGISYWHCVPLLVGAMYSFISYMLDKRHTTILRECYRIGADIEMKTREDPAIFFFLRNLHYTKGSLTQILHIIYLTSTVLLLVLSFVVIIFKWNR